MDRNFDVSLNYKEVLRVALRKESVDRNLDHGIALIPHQVALRKESVDRNILFFDYIIRPFVALRKESVDRNSTYVIRLPRCQVVALRKESVDRNWSYVCRAFCYFCRSPQGERG